MLSEVWNVCRFLFSRACGLCDKIDKGFQIFDASRQLLFEVKSEWEGVVNSKIMSIFCRHHLDDFKLGRVFEKLEEGRQMTDVARNLHSVVSRFHAAFHIFGMCN